MGCVAAACLEHILEIWSLVICGQRVRLSHTDSPVKEKQKIM